MNSKLSFSIGERVKCIRFPYSKGLMFTTEIELGEELTILSCILSGGQWWLRFKEKNYRHLYLADRFDSVR